MDLLQLEHFLAAAGRWRRRRIAFAKTNGSDDWVSSGHDILVREKETAHMRADPEGGTSDREPARRLSSGG